MDARFVKGNYETVDYTPTADVAAGDIIVLNAKCYIAHRPIAANELGALAARGGIYAVTKAAGTGVDYDMGEKAYWNAAGSVVDDSAAGDTPLGWFAEDGTNAATEILVEHGAW